MSTQQEPVGTPILDRANNRLNQHGDCDAVFGPIPFTETRDERRARFQIANAAYAAQRRNAQRAWDEYEASPGADTAAARQRLVSLSLLPVFQ